MVGTNLKAETMSLMEKRSALEAEMNAIIDRLCRPNGSGLSGNLVDSEGFPRSDVDIPKVRAERRRLAESRNDHKEITEKMNENIQLLHSARLSPVSTSVKDSGLNNQNLSIVSTVASASFNDGLLLGNQVVKIGNMEAGNNLLERLATEGRTNQGNTVPVTIIRQGVH